MKNKLLFFSILLCTAIACHKSPEPEPDTVRCAEVIKKTGALIPSWIRRNMSEFSIHPVVFEDQVILSQWMAPGEVKLMGFKGLLGTLLWESNVSAYLSDSRYWQMGSRLYFTDKSQHSLLSFDINTQQVDTIWTGPPSAKLSLYFAAQEGFIICPITQDIPGDSVAVSAHLINLQNGISREVVRFHTLVANNDGSGIVDPQVTITATGDTVFCFARIEYQRGFDVFARFSSWNISKHTIYEGDISPGHYFGNYNSLVVEGQYAWFLAGNKLQCVNVGSNMVVWTRIDNGLTNSQLLVKQGKLLTSSRSISALDALTGTLLWNQPMQDYGHDLQHSFLKDGQLFLVHSGHLVSLDFETGCLTLDEYLPASLGDGLSNMVRAPDRQHLYLMGIKNFYVVPTPL